VQETVHLDAVNYLVIVQLVYNFVIIDIVIFILNMNIIFQVIYYLIVRIIVCQEGFVIIIL